MKTSRAEGAHRDYRHDPNKASINRLNARLVEALAGRFGRARLTATYLESRALGTTSALRSTGLDIVATIPQHDFEEYDAIRHALGGALRANLVYDDFESTIRGGIGHQDFVFLDACCGLRRLVPSLDALFGTKTVDTSSILVVTQIMRSSKVGQTSSDKLDLLEDYITSHSGLTAFGAACYKNCYVTCWGDPAYKTVVDTWMKDDGWLVPPASGWCLD